MNWFGFELSSFLWVFIILNVVNVVIQTIKSIATVNWGKWAAAITNAIAYGLYTLVVIFMSAEGLGILWKALIIALANLVGVYAVKLWEEKSRKDKLWLVQASLKAENTYFMHKELKAKNIPHNYIENVGNLTIFNCYCATQNESLVVKELLNKYHAKYFVSESKVL